MIRFDYILRNGFFALLTLVIVVVFNFYLFRILPGDPVRLLFRNPRMTAEIQDRLRAEFGLDKPVWLDGAALREGNLSVAFDSQFTAYIRNLFDGNLGISFANRSDVSTLLAERIGRTVILVFIGEILSILLGSVIGLLAAWKRGTPIDAIALITGLITWAMPTFFFGIILVIIGRGILPVGGMVTPGLADEGTFEYYVDVGKHLILPTITLAVVNASGYMLIMRSTVLEVLSEPYILTAKAKGMTHLQVLLNHALKNSMLPMVTLIALTLGYTVSGAIQVETVFSWPGVGRLIYDSIAKQDYPVLQGAFLLIAVSVILANFAADVLYTMLDPRVTLEQTA